MSDEGWIWLFDLRDGMGWDGWIGLDWILMLEVGRLEGWYVLCVKTRY